MTARFNLNVGSGDSDGQGSAETLFHELLSRSPGLREMDAGAR